MLPIVQDINALEPETQKLSDAELAAKTVEFRERIANGAALDDVLVEAFAVCREAGRRVLNMRHFDVQLIGGMVLHRGQIAEMKTGEGKTLVATLPVYLNALEGKGVRSPPGSISKLGHCAIAKTETVIMRSEDILAAADAVYLDASALIKTGIVEPPGDRAMQIVRMSDVPLFTSIVGFGEVISCFGRKEKQRSIGGSEGYLHSVRMIMKDFEIGKILSVEPPDDRPRFLKLARRLVEMRGDLGGGDLWHVMAALELQRKHAATVFLAFDDELLKAASQLGVRSGVDGRDLDCEILAEALRAAGRFPR